jgi:hypothetical protein
MALTIAKRRAGGGWGAHGNRPGGARRGAWSGLLAAGVLVACGASDDDGASYDSSVRAPSPSGAAGGAPLTPSAGPAISGLNAEESGEDRDAPASDVAAPTDAAPGATPPAGVPAIDPPSNVIEPGPGTLTAGTWDDNRNFDRFLSYRAELESRQMAGLPDFLESEQRAAAERAAQRTAHGKLDVALVIDTTGSMGDELRYLQTEFEALSSAIESAYPDAEQRWALVVYRDVGDVYVTTTYDFEASAATFRQQLLAQSAADGGDLPEAPDAALAVMDQLGWRGGPDVARLAFWVADAPHHVENTAAFSTAVEDAAAQDVHLYPVASSGIDELTEYSMRASAQLTLGRYLFLTNDSGVGNDHKEPSIPCYFVTTLDDAILRMVDVEMSGAYHEPDAAQVLRTGGDPTEGACSLAGGQIVFAF